jgi:hypothetical protein
MQPNGKSDAGSRHLGASLILCLLTTSSANAFDLTRLGADQGKLLLTGGFSTLDGSGGGALASWALISGYGSNDSYGVNAHVTAVPLSDLRLTSYGLAVGLFDRVEVSANRENVEMTGTTLDGLELALDTFGVKVRLVGDAIYAQDTPMPQIAIGAQWKQHAGIDNGARSGAPGLVSVEQLGADDEAGLDVYVAATKLFLAHNLLVNATLRYTQGNQFGLLGFGGDRKDSASVEIETTVAYMLQRQLAVGVEFRTKPKNLRTDDESDAFDAFIAWAPTRNVSIVAAYANIGSVLAPVTGEDGDQAGAYVSVQVGF